MPSKPDAQAKVLLRLSFACASGFDRHQECSGQVRRGGYVIGISLDSRIAGMTRAAVARAWAEPSWPLSAIFQKTSVASSIT